MLDLLLPFFDDAGIISINGYLFQKLDHLDREIDDGDLPVVDAVSILRFFIRLIELGTGDAVVRGQAILDLVQANFPDLHLLLTSPASGVRPPVDSRFNYSRFCGNFKHLMVRINFCRKHNLGSGILLELFSYR